jgi:diguanylate cyclase (GGDEF)-like protein
MPDLSTLGFAGSPTSLFTPSEVRKLMRIEFERAQRYRYAVSCMVIQVDRLEHLHTVHGFESKTEVLQRVVDLVRSATRAGDLLGYLVEDRLVCIFPHTSARAVRGLSERLLSTSRALVFQVGPASLRITLSIGVSHNEHPGELSFETLKRVAEEGLAVADAAGGDRWAETELYGIYEAQRSREEQPAPAPALPQTQESGYRGALERMVAEDGDLERAVGELVEDLLERASREARDELAAEQASAPPEADPEKELAYQREIDLLRRRVGKLTESLGLTEQELLRLREFKGEDDGLSSVYREVQGLSLEDAKSELKKHLMSSIFEANLDLQSKRAAG